MVRENRIRIMTAIAAYEKRHREELSGTDQWFRSDYIGVRILTYVVWSIRYYQAEKRRRTYGRLIDRLEAEYQREEKEVPSTGKRREGQNRSRGHGAGNP